MSNTLKYTVYPKEIDASSNEFEQNDYVIENTYTTMTEWSAVVANTSPTLTEVLVPTLVSAKVFELQSDQNLSLVIYQSNGTTPVATITGIKNFISSVGTAGSTTGGNYIYKVVNVSGTNANVIVRQYA